jgi:beta-N-acetylhexosaminidase
MTQLLQAAAAKIAVVAMGNPYLAMDFPGVQTYLCTFSNAPTSERAAAKALFGEMQVNGKLPVSLPGIAERGFGLQLKPEEMLAAGAAGQKKSNLGEMQ